MTGRQAVDPPAACLLKRRRASVPALLRDLSHAGSWRPRVRGVSWKPRRAGLLAAASPAIGLLAGFLCTSMWITCAKRRQACAHEVEMLGILPPRRAHEQALNWENTTRSMCTQRKAGIVHTPRREGS